MRLRKLAGAGLMTDKQFKLRKKKEKMKKKSRVQNRRK